jgi:hypothetical protein
MSFGFDYCRIPISTQWCDRELQYVSGRDFVNVSMTGVEGASSMFDIDILD